MSGFQLEPGADISLDEIYDYTFFRWGEDQADAYIEALFEEFRLIAEKRVPMRVIPAELGADGFFIKWRHHVIYWKIADDGEIAISAIVHERMQQVTRLRDLVAGDEEAP